MKKKHNNISRLTTCTAGYTLGRGDVSAAIGVRVLIVLAESRIIMLARLVAPHPLLTQMPTWNTSSSLPSYQGLPKTHKLKVVIPCLLLLLGESTAAALPALADVEDTTDEFVPMKA